MSSLSIGLGLLCLFSIGKSADEDCHGTDCTDDLAVAGERRRRLVEITNYVTYNGYDYATISNADPHGSSPGCEASEEYELPDGWEIPEAGNADANAVITMYPWSTYAIVYGYPVEASGYNDQQGVTWETTTLYSGGCGSCYVVSQTDGFYRASYCTIRVLIRKPSLPQCTAQENAYGYRAKCNKDNERDGGEGGEGGEPELPYPPMPMPRRLKKEIGDYCFESVSGGNAWSHGALKPTDAVTLELYQAADSCKPELEDSGFIGYVTVYYRSGDELVVTYNIQSDLFVSEVNLYYGCEELPSDIDPSSFGYNAIQPDNLYSVSINDLPDCGCLRDPSKKLYVIAHALACEWS